MLELNKMVVLGYLSIVFGGSYHIKKFEEAVAKYRNFTIYSSNIKDIDAVYCVNLSFFNSP